MDTNQFWLVQWRRGFATVLILGITTMATCTYQDHERNASEVRRLELMSTPNYVAGQQARRDAAMFEAMKR